MPGAEPWVGVWRLLACEARSGDRTWRPHGEDPVGRLVYTPGGRVLVALGDRDRPGFARPDPRGGTPEECASALRSFAAYTGTWRRVDARVEHRIELAWAPPWTGTVQVREVALDGDRLTLTTPPTTVDGERWSLTLTWQREE